MTDENTEEIKENKPIEEEAEDDVVEFVFNDDGEEDIKATLKKLRKDLKAVRTEKQEYLTNWQRERADFQNFKKDEAARSERLLSLTKERFAYDLLPVLDAYDMAFANKEAWEKVDKNWRIGVEYIHQQLMKALDDNGISEVAASVGQPFDPNIHQPIESVPTDDKAQDNTISAVIQKGYKTTTKTIRPARVNVWAYKGE